jgi:tRNA threonylcarbamoyl adenosine modification protein YeaZ
MNRHRLVIDTSSGTSVAIFANSEAVAEVNFEDTMKHAERIGLAIEQALAEAKITPKDIGSVVVGRGPAPFTGLRIGIAAATTFALARGIPLFGVTSLDAIALAESSGSTGEALLVTTDARRGEVYWALYSGGAGAPRALRGPSVGKQTEVLAELDAAGIGFRRSTVLVSAANLGRVFELQLAEGIDSHDTSPFYLREADAKAPPAGTQYGKPVN